MHVLLRVRSGRKLRKRKALYDQNMFEGDINITLDEIARFYDGPNLDDVAVSLRAELAILYNNYNKAAWLQYCYGASTIAVI